MTSSSPGLLPTAAILLCSLQHSLVLAFVTPTTLGGQFAAFLLFRFFDMVKPAPIRYYDRTLKGFGVRGGYGVMVDDILAAFYTLLVFALWRSF